MKKLLGLIGLILMATSLAAHEIDSLYSAFLANRGENAIRIANEIMDMTDDTTHFTTETSAELVSEALLKKLIFWHYDRAEMAEAVNYTNKAKVGYEQRGDLFNLAGCYNILGVAYQRMGQLEEAIDSYNRCNEVMAQLNEQEANPFYEKNIRYTTNNMAAIYTSMGEFEVAEEMYYKCINMVGVMENDMDYLDMATYQQNLANVYLSQTETLEGNLKKEKVGKAVALAEQALEYSLEYNDKSGKIIQRQMVVASAYFADDRMDQAFGMLAQALQSAEDEEDRFLQTEVELLYGRFYNEMGQYRESESHFQKAILLSTEGQYEECLSKAYKGACDAAKHFAPGKALEYFEKSVALHDSVFNEKQQALVRDYQVKYDLAEKEHQLEIQEKNNRTQAAELIILFVFALLLVVIMIILVRLIRVRKKQNETLARLNDTQNRILSVASHDVKNSVLAQNMVLKLVNDHFDAMPHDELKEKMAVLKRGSDELKDKLYNILHWIYGELGKEATPSAAFNLLQCVEQGIKPHEEALKAKNLVVVNDIAPNLQCFDKINVFNIVFQNLFTNAIKFSKEGGEITVRALEDGRDVWIEVIDEGVGISPQRLQELMHDPVKSTTGTSGERGTGIGLFVSRQLMVKNGGLLLIESVEGQGTTIKFNMKKN